MTEEQFHDHLEQRALRIGLRPREWEKFSPAEIYAMEREAVFNRSRDLEAFVAGVVTIANRIPFMEDPVRMKDVLKRLYGYEPPDTE